jgi:hypothetical protein
MEITNTFVHIASNAVYQANFSIDKEEMAKIQALTKEEISKNPLYLYIKDCTKEDLDVIEDITDYQDL